MRLALLKSSEPVPQHVMHMLRPQILKQMQSLCEQFGVPVPMKELAGVKPIIGKAYICVSEAILMGICSDKGLTVEEKRTNIQRLFYWMGSRSEEGHGWSHNALGCSQACQQQLLTLDRKRATGIKSS